MQGITKPGPVNLKSGNINANWSLFKQKFEIFLIATGKSEVDSKTKWAILMGEAGDDVLELYNSFKDKLVVRVVTAEGELTETDNRMNYKEVVDKIDEYTLENKSVTGCREMFNARRQKPGEPFTNWLTDLKNLVKACDYQNIEESMLIDRIIWGVADKRLKETLRGKPKLTLEQTIEICKAAEALAKDDPVSVDHVEQKKAHKRPYQHVVSQQSSGPSYHRGGGGRFISNRGRGRGGRTAYPSGPYNCKKCATRHSAMKCPAYGKECLRCGDMNHYAKVCQRPEKVRQGHKNKPYPTKRARVETVESTAEKGAAVTEKPKPSPYVLESFSVEKCCCGHRPAVKPGEATSSLSVEEEKKLLDEGNTPEMDSVDSLTKEYTETLKLEGKHFVLFKLDPGSQADLLPLDVYNQLNEEDDYKLKENNIVLRGFDDRLSTTEGSVTMLTETKYGNAKHCNYVITKVACRPILGIESCEDLNLVKRVKHPPSEVCAVTKVSTLPESKEEFVKSNIDVFQGLGQFKQTVRIEVKSDAPTGSCPPRRYSHAITEKLKVKLDVLEAQGVIEKVTNEMPKFISNLVIREKGNGDLRLCLDPETLNRAIVMKKYPIPTLEEISCKVRDKSVFTVLDLKDWFWHASLDEESSTLCSFATPYGVYKFKKLPFGICSAPEIFQYLTDLAFNGTGAIIYFDDILIAGKDFAEHDELLLKVLERARAENVKFNQNKTQYRLAQVMFLGFLWSKNQIKIDPGRIAAIQALKEPETRHNLQKVCGTFNHLRKFLPQMGTIAVPLCELLSSAVTYKWLPMHTEAFQKLKDCVSNAFALVPFDPSKPIVVQADASQFGLGAVLLQENKPVSSASRKLTDSEVNYAQIEKEMLALSYASEKFKHFIYGMPNVKYQTDHQPLVSIFKKPVHKITNNRLKKLRLKMMRFNPTVEYLPGKYMFLADLLSRNFIEDPVDDDPEMVEVVHEVTQNLAISPGIMSVLKIETEKDLGLKAVKNYYQNGWPNSKDKAQPESWPYWSERDNIFVEDDLVILVDKVIVPPSIRAKVLESLHAAHQGISKTTARARQVVFWPGITNDIKTFLKECRLCERYSCANYKEPLIPHKIPDLRFQKVSADIKEINSQSYLIVVDNFSKWLEIRKLSSKSSGSVINALRAVFTTHGYPEIIFGDNNPLNSYECKQYAQSIGSSIETSSPEYARSNGLAEKGVHIALQLVEKAIDEGGPYEEKVLEYNNTPLAGLEYSPAQILMSRMCRTKVPARTQNLLPKVVDPTVQQQNLQTRVKQRHDKRARRKPVEFSVGDSIVFWKNKRWLKGTVVEKHAAPRSYIIRQLNGRTLRRNTWHLRKSSTRPDRWDGPVHIPYEINVNDPVLQIEPSHQPEPQPEEMEVQQRWRFEDHPEMHQAGGPRRPRRRTRGGRRWHTHPQIQVVEGPARRTRSGRVVKLPARFRK